MVVVVYLYINRALLRKARKTNNDRVRHTCLVTLKGYELLDSTQNKSEKACWDEINARVLNAADIDNI